MIENLEMWSSILKQNKRLNVPNSFIQRWEDSQWLLISMMYKLDGTYIFELVEFDEEMYPSTGIFKIAVSEKELEDNFYEYKRR